MKKLILALGLCALITAAEAGTLKDWFIDMAAKNGMDIDTMVITPGYKVLIDGNSTAVVGNQTCPLSDGWRMYFIGGYPRDSHDGCAVIEKDTTTVLMQLVVNGKPSKELWTVEWQTPSRISLRRPNGEFVISDNSLN